MIKSGRNFLQLYGQGSLELPVLRVGAPLSSGVKVIHTSP